MDIFSLLKEQFDSAYKEPDKIPEFYALLWRNSVKISYEQQIEILLLSAKLIDKESKAKAWHQFSEGAHAAFSAEYVKAIDQLGNAMELFESLEDEYGKGAVNCVRILCYRSMGEMDKAQISSQESLENFKGIKQNNMYAHFLSIAYYQAGELCKQDAKHERAIEYFKRGLDFEKDNQLIRGRMFNGIGGVYTDISDWDRAFDYFSQSISAVVKDGGHMLESKNYADIGNLYLKKGDLEKALSYNYKSLEIREKNNQKAAAITNYIQLAGIFFRKKSHIEAMKYGKMVVEKSKDLNLIPKLLEGHRILSEIYEVSGDTTAAYEHFKKYHEYKEQIFSQEVTRRIEQNNSRHQISLMEQQKEIFRLKNVSLKTALDEIGESIRYARRIQEAILPPVQLFKKFLPESFVLYKPKDIVSGDFYWLEASLSPPSGGLRGGFFAAADCTGHGVPGAFVSIVAHNALKRATREYKLTAPAAILEKVNELIEESFDQNEQKVQDGMDIALCSLTLPPLGGAGGGLQYAGANNPLWIINPNRSEWPKNSLPFGPVPGHKPGEGWAGAEVKADKQPIGKHEGRKPFTNHTIELQKGDTIYIFSDGFADQFGGERGKKFKSKAFKELLLSVQDKSMQEQKMIIDQRFEEWKGELEQVDDVCVIGVRI